MAAGGRSARLCFVAACGLSPLLAAPQGVLQAFTAGRAVLRPGSVPRAEAATLRMGTARLRQHGDAGNFGRSCCWQALPLAACLALRLATLRAARPTRRAAHARSPPPQAAPTWVARAAGRAAAETCSARQGGCPSRAARLPAGQEARGCIALGACERQVAVEQQSQAEEEEGELVVHWDKLWAMLCVGSE
mmetsp:Transcript_100494/g.304946  ORF Transcript_100494/g.304946 Transcript_100494/m.304946 type:complete len:191 (+) Transcript_100494:92-664(+)